MAVRATKAIVVLARLGEMSHLVDPDCQTPATLSGRNSAE